MSPKVSVIICTQNRASSLQATINAIGLAHVPSDLPAELLVVDNRSTDNTADIVKQTQISNMPLRYVHEPRAGKGHAYNTGLRESVGEILLFTDDDVIVPESWIEGMCRPIKNAAADAVAGGVRIAPHLLRKWMTSLHRTWLASDEYLDRERPEELIGANMAFARHVLEKVPAFDTELGPGALGQSDDSLFSWQLLQACYHFAPAWDVEVEHHFDRMRLSRKSFKKMASNKGRSGAYVMHHWQHEAFERPYIRLIKLWIRLLMARVQHFPEWLSREGMREWEMRLLNSIHHTQAWLTERHRPRNYEKNGLKRLENLTAT